MDDGRGSKGSIKQGGSNEGKSIDRNSNVSGGPGLSNFEGTNGGSKGHPIKAKHISVKNSNNSGNKMQKYFIKTSFCPGEKKPMPESSFARGGGFLGVDSEKSATGSQSTKSRKSRLGKSNGYFLNNSRHSFAGLSPSILVQGHKEGPKISMNKSFQNPKLLRVENGVPVTITLSVLPVTDLRDFEEKSHCHSGEIDIVKSQ